MARAALSGESFEGIEAVIQNPDGKRWVARLTWLPFGTSAGRLSVLLPASRM